MTTIMQTTRTDDDGRKVYAVLCNGTPGCSDTHHEQGTVALAEIYFKRSRPPCRLVRWNADTGETVEIARK